MLYYCGFDSFLQFKHKSGRKNIFFQPLTDLILDQQDKIINAYIGWCSLFLQTGNGQVLYLGYTKGHNKNNALTVCSQVPKYIVNIECGSKDTFLLTLDLDLYKWTGFNFEKTFPTQISLNLPFQIDTQDKDPSECIKVEQVCIGAEFSCILTEDGKAFLLNITEPELNCQLTNEIIKSACAGNEHILLLTEKNTVLSYGKSSRGQLGHGSVDSVLEKALVIEALEGLKIKAIAAGGWHSIALSDTGDVYVWGWNESGQLGLPREKVTAEVVPKLLEISEDDCFMAVSAGSRHSMAVSENGILFGWGWNKYGQLGLDPATIVYCESPQVIPLDEKVSSICCKFWSSLIDTEPESENES